MCFDSHHEVKPGHFIRKEAALCLQLELLVVIFLQLDATLFFISQKIVCKSDTHQQLLVLKDVDIFTGVINHNV